jgi:TolB-like protein/predicted Zn-dependent protease
MSSIIEEYDYDIFISYRQKDNKRDGWVTEFVDNLKGELEAALKDTVSVYFDINPHDGLLETHDVDASLKKKLKCLIFIPILSRTYCDSRAYAWVNEFKAFVKQASQDRFGLRVTLPNGNIANRVLPVKIHDLDVEDTAEYESLLGGVLRGIEFIYKEPGVNRPLTPEDDFKTNLNKTRYRNQINKVALAVKEILTAISKHNRQAGVLTKENAKSVLVAESIEEFEKSVAVLPFINDSPDEENTYFINGLMEEILNNLQKIKDLRVISRTSVEQYRGQRKPVPEIAGELGVNYIVEGSGQKYGNSFRLRTQLIMAAKESHLWGGSYQQKIVEVEDIFRIQSQIAESIAKELKAIITPQEKDLIEKIPTKELEAHDAYLKGQFFWRKLTSNDLDTALKYFELAKDKDPGFALAYAGICDVWIGRQQMGIAPPSEAGPKAFEAAVRALELDSNRPEVHYSLALMYTWGMWDWEAGEDAFRKSILINSNHAEAHAHYSHLLNSLGRQTEAIEHINMAITLDPINPLIISLHAMDLYFIRQYDKVVKTALMALEMDPSNFVALYALASAFYALGKYEESIDAWNNYYSSLYSGINHVFNQKRTECSFKQLMELEADTILKQLKNSYVLPVDICQLYIMSGNYQKALDWLEKGFEEHDPNMPYIKVPLLDPIREYPKFQEIASKMNLPYN